MQGALGQGVLRRLYRILDVVLRISFAAHCRRGFSVGLISLLVCKVPCNLRITRQFDEFEENQGFLLGEILKFALARGHQVSLVNYLQQL